jgi:tetratricopeptide (TPR) repeat protein
MGADSRDAGNLRIDSIRRKFGVRLEAAARYRSGHRSEIENIGDMFRLEGEVKQKVLALMYLITLGEEDPAVQSCRSRLGLKDAAYDPGGPLTDRYKVPLVTALIYNPAFYAMAENYHAAAGADFAVAGIGADGKAIAFPGRANLRFTWPAFALAAGLAVFFCIAVLVKLRVLPPEARTSNEWVTGLREPPKAPGGAAYSDGDDGARIGILSPLMGMVMGEGEKAAGSGSVIDYYSEKIRHEKTNSGWYVSRGVAYTLGGYLDSAIKDFNRAIALNPNNASAYYNRAIARMGKDGAGTDAAFADLESALFINPGDADSRYAIGVLYYRQYEYDPSQPALDRAVHAFEQIQGYKDSGIILNYLRKSNDRHP